MRVDEQKIFEIFANSLALDVDQVKADSNIVVDLGAESIDFLDITFQLERAFNIRIPRGEAVAIAKSGLSDDEFADNNVVTEAGLANLRSRELALDPLKLKSGMSVHELPQAFTVQTFINIVARQLAKAPEQAIVVGAMGTLPEAKRA